MFSTWPRAAADAASWALAAAVFAFLDVLDALLCLVYAFLDGVLEESPVPCYCHGEAAAAAVGGDEASDTLLLYGGRRSALRDALLGLVRRRGGAEAAAAAPCKWRSPRWSDCACESCVAWRAGDGRLHVVVKEPAAASGGRRPNKGGSCAENESAAAAAGTTPGTGSAEAETDDSTTTTAIFIHGFGSSSSFWAETVFREPSMANSNCRLLAVDLLGFGQSPKPADCMYTLRDHVAAIERSVIEPRRDHLGSFHLVGHSMGCVIALALAARHPARVKSITLVAPPYFLPPSGGDDDDKEQKQKARSQVALNRLAGKKLWPPQLFGTAVMSWYEHVGRTVCLFVCKNHRLWECLFSLFLLTTTNKDAVGFLLRDLTRHTHHSAWHTMHNVVCGGARLQDSNLDAVDAAGVGVQLIHGAHDQLVPIECSRHLKAKLPRARLRVVDGCDHATVVLGRERGFAEDLTAFWSSLR